MLTRQVWNIMWPMQCSGDMRAQCMPGKKYINLIPALAQASKFPSIVCCSTRPLAPSKTFNYIFSQTMTQLSASRRKPNSAKLSPGNTWAQWGWVGFLWLLEEPRSIFIIEAFHHRLEFLQHLWLFRGGFWIFLRQLVRHMHKCCWSFQPFVFV